MRTNVCKGCLAALIACGDYCHTIKDIMSEFIEPESLESEKERGDKFFQSSTEKLVMESLTKEAESGSLSAQVYLAKVYFDGHGTVKDDAKAFSYYLAASEQGHAHSQLMVGLLYAQGRGVAADNERAFPYFQSAADKGLVDALYAVGDCYHEGKGVAVNHALAVQNLTAAADQGHAGAQFLLGACFKFGHGVQEDLVKSTHFYKLAADQNHTNALVVLGLIYMGGEGVEVDREAAMKCFEKASVLGNGGGLFVVGQLHLQGEDNVGKPFPHDLSLAVDYFQRAAAQGNQLATHALRNIEEGNDPQALGALGMSYAVGVHVPENFATALRLLKRAAEKGFVEILIEAGQAYQSGADSIGRAVIQNEAFGFACLKAAAEFGHPIAQYMTACALMEGVGVEIDAPKAATYVKLAAAQDLGEAVLLLAGLYGNGQGVDVDPEAAVECYERAAAMGFIQAELALALIYAEGTIVPANKTRAAEHLERVRARNDPATDAALGECFLTGSGGAEVNVETALMYLERAAAGDDAEALCLLGQCYADGDKQGIPVDTKKAIGYFRRAAEQGHPESTEELQKLELGGDV